MWSRAGRRARSSTTTAISTCRRIRPAHRLPDNSGFAGFRFQEARNGKLDWRKNDWVAFLGASYFRAIGELYQYGLSARGLAVDVAVFGKTEEFPDFTHVYFETPAPGSDTRHGLCPPRRPKRRRRLSASSCSRAAAVVMDIEKRALPAPGRRAPRHRAPDLDVLVLGNGEADRHRLAARDPRFRRPRALDRRRRAHLAPAQQSAADHHLGLRRREPAAASACCSATGNFDHYLDGVYYDRRPSLWIEPHGDWGRGSVQLVEIPTDDEIHDNIVAMWVPAEPARAGTAYEFRYRMHWVGRRALSDPARPLRRDPARQWRAGRHGRGRRACASSWSSSRASRSTRLPAGVLPEAGALGLPRRVLERPHRGGAGRRARPLARPVRPDRDRHRAGRDALLPAQRRRGAQRDLALPVPPDASEVGPSMPARPRRELRTVRPLMNELWLDRLRLAHARMHCSRIMSRQPCYDHQPCTHRAVAAAPTFSLLRLSAGQRLIGAAVLSGALGCSSF